MSAKRIVAVVGGGPGGIAVAKALDAHFDVTLIEKRTHYFHSIASPRGAVEPGFENKLLIPYDKLLKHGRVLHAEVSEISSTEIAFTDSTIPRLAFDYLVIALGSSTKFPVRPVADYDASKTAWSHNQDLIRQAEKILVVGGGPVGLELSGEIKNKYPQKSVTLIHGGNQLISSQLSPKFHAKLTDSLQKLGIDVILSDRIAADNLPEIPQLARTTYTTTGGKSIEADLVFVCTGSTVNNGPLQSHFSDKLDNGRIKVNKFLQVEGYDNIFAVGDITNTPEFKLAYLAGEHAKVVASNIQQHHKGKKLKEYKPSPPVMFLTLGPNAGVGQMPNGWVAGNFMVKQIKGKQLFVGKTWGSLNAKEPK